MLKERKRTGLEAPVVHKDSIADDDWVLLKEYFANASTTLDVKKVTQFVWFHTTLHFCLRGNEAQPAAASPIPSVLSAQGSTWSNVTINMMAPTPEKRKKRLSLKLKKKPKKEAEEKQEYRKLICAHFHFLPFVSFYSVFPVFLFVVLFLKL